ncbi:hypothetical protein GGR40_003784 [Novosphingobium gossypii]
MKKANALLEASWRKGWLAYPVLDPAQLMATATRTTGLSDFGEENGWRERLTLLCEALLGEAELSALGNTVAYGQLLAALANRLRAAELWRRQPDIEKIEMRAPVIIVGQMRSGSTRMQRMLGCDDRLTCTRFFESWNPVPRWSQAGIDDRAVRAWIALYVARRLNPGFDVVHPTSARSVDEEIGIQNIALFGAAFEAQWRIPSFARAGEVSETIPVYLEFCRFLQTIRWLRGRPCNKPWVLKLPQFGQDLSSVLSVFPDARLIVLDRDPVSVVGSSSSLVHNQMIVQSHAVDRQWIGKEWLAKTLLRDRRIQEGLARHAPAHVHVHYDAMQEDWRGEMRRVYSCLGLPFTTDLEQRMRSSHRRPTPKGRGDHLYTIDQYGLSEVQVRRAFASASGQSDEPPSAAAA